LRRTANAFNVFKGLLIGLIAEDRQIIKNLGVF